MKAIIFDMDGTLIDSMQYWYKLASKYLLNRNIISSDEFNNKIKKMTLLEMAKYTINEYHIDDVNEFELKKIFLDIMKDYYINNVELKEGVYNKLLEAKNKGYKLCIATATDRYLTDIILKKLKIYDMFEFIITCHDVKARKTKPDIYFKALEMLNEKIEDVYVFEDVLHAITTLKNAGFKVVGVYDESSDDDKDKIKKLSNYYIESFNEWEF